MKVRCKKNVVDQDRDEDDEPIGCGWRLFSCFFVWRRISFIHQSFFGLILYIFPTPRELLLPFFCARSIDPCKPSSRRKPFDIFSLKNKLISKILRNSCLIKNKMCMLHLPFSIRQRQYLLWVYGKANSQKLVYANAIRHQFSFSLRHFNKFLSTYRNNTCFLFWFQLLKKLN